MPQTTAPTAAADDLAACRRMLRTGSRSFHAASYLLPRSVREPATALYAFCRLADDAVDEGGGDADVLAELRDRIRLAYAGRPRPIAADRAFSAVVRQYAMPVELPEALLEGFLWDAQGRRYETIEDLKGYAARVAGTVGAMMAVVMGARTKDVLARACDLGLAMQLSNIARDVGEDARAGRLYLPMAWLREAGLAPARWLADPVPDQRLGLVVERLLVEADRLYRRAEAGIARLPLACRPGIHAARRLYAAIGHEVRRQRYDSVSRRAVVSTGRKLGLVGRALGGSVVLRGGDVTEPADAATEFLVSAAAMPAPLKGVRAHALWLIDLFEQLERMILSAQAHMAIGFFPRRLSELQYHPVFSAQMELFCGEKHALFRKPDAKITRSAIEKAAHAQRGYVSLDQAPEKQRSFTYSARAHSIEGLAHLVLSGHYLAFLPAHYADQWVAQGMMRSVKPDEYAYVSQYEIIRRKSAARTPAELKFFDFVRAAASDG